MILVLDTLLTIRGNQIRIFQVFKNFFDNALKREHATEIVISSRTLSETITSSISNNGVPIPLLVV